MEQIGNIKIDATPRRLKVVARLGYETVEPTLMSYLLGWVLLVMIVIMGYVAFDRDLPKGFDRFDTASLVCLGIVALAANFLNRSYLRADSRGVNAGILPVPVNGFSFHRHVPLHRIAGIYVSQCDLWVRLRSGLFRSFEVHALTTGGEPVCLLQRIPAASTALDLATEIRKRLGSLPPKEVPLRGQIRYTSERSIKFAGFLPAWLYWAGLVLIGLEGPAIPLIRVLGWHSTSARVTAIGGLYHARRECKVTFDTPDGPVAKWVENDCASKVDPGDIVTIYFSPRQPVKARILAIPIWPISLLFAATGASVLIFGREPVETQDGARVLWRERFKVISRYWHVAEKKNAEIADGTISLFGLKGARPLPNTAQAFDPGAVQVRVARGERTVPEEGAGILFGASFDGIGYVFGILPQQQTAFARRVGKDWSVNLMPAAYVPEIRPQPGEWNTLRVAMSEERAHFFVNGVRAGSIEYESPMGGGMVGLYADFCDGKALWQFTELTVLA